MPGHCLVLKTFIIFEKWANKKIEQYSLIEIIGKKRNRLYNISTCGFVSVTDGVSDVSVWYPRTCSAFTITKVRLSKKFREKIETWGGCRG